MYSGCATSKKDKSGRHHARCGSHLYQLGNVRCTRVSYRTCSIPSGVQILKLRGSTIAHSASGIDRSAVAQVTTLPSR